MIVVGLSGRKGAGKSAAASELVATHGFREVSFAGPLKDAISVALGIDRARLDDPMDKGRPDPFWGASPRELMQIVGTELFRDALARSLPLHFGPDRPSVWVRVCERAVRELISSDEHVRVVISDVRFPDEIDLVRRLGGTLVHVERSGIVSTDDHASERFGAHGTSDADLILRNDGTLDDLGRSTALIVRLVAEPTAPGC